MELHPLHRATAIPATARRPAATEPIFFVAPPVKPTEPVFEAVAGVIGDPVAAPEPDPVPEAAPDPEPAPEPEEAPEVPVAIGAVPVANPVEPATPVELIIH